MKDLVSFVQTDQIKEGRGEEGDIGDREREGGGIGGDMQPQ